VFWACCCLALLGGCGNETAPIPTRTARRTAASRPAGTPTAQSTQPVAGTPASGAARGYRLAHVIVCLCDNKHQGIAPVPAALGNGQDAAGNLHWGAMYGVKTFFHKSGRWEEVTGEIAVSLQDRGALRAMTLFRGAGRANNVYVLAEAYDGSKMSLALRRFLEAAAGRLVRTVAVGRGRGQVILRAGGAADLVCFVGHNGMMDDPPAHLPTDGPGPNPGGAVVLACKSAPYFAEPLRRAGCPPLITTSGLMAPEAYTLDAVLHAWGAGEPAATIHLRAAEAYAKYQKCRLAAAKNLFVCGGR